MYKKLFKNRNFVLLTIGSFVSSIGDYLYNIGVTMYLYSITNSISSIAMMWLSRGLLRIPMLYLSGIIADSCNKKRVIFTTNLVSVLFAFLFIFANNQRLWIVYILAFSLQSLNDIDVSSETAILPELVLKEELSYANSVFSFLESTGIFLSPAIGGILYKLYGSRILFIINSISFFIASMLFLFIKYSFNKPPVFEKRVGIIKSGVEGYKVLSKFPSTKTVFLISSVIAIIGRFYETYKVAVSDILLNLNPEGIVYFDYALAIGGLTVPLIMKAMSKRSQASIFALSTMVTGIGYIAFGSSHNFVLTFAALVILGLTQNIQGIYSRTIIQNNIPQEFIGRVFSFYKIIITAFAILGLLIVTPLYDLVGIGYSFLIFSIILIGLCSLLLNGSSNKVIA